MSTNIDINIVGGKLLGRDKANRADSRDTQLQREKDSRTAADPTITTALQKRAMKGERGNDKPKAPKPAATPSAVKKENISMFLLYEENNRFGISSVNTYPDINWFNIDAPPEPLPELPPHVAGPNEHIDLISSNVLNRVRNETYVLPAGGAKAIVIHARNYISCAQRISAKIKNQTLTPITTTTHTVVDQRYLLPDYRFGNRTTYTKISSNQGPIPVPGFDDLYPVTDPDGILNSYVINVKFLYTASSMFGYEGKELGYVYTPAHDVYEYYVVDRDPRDEYAWAEVADSEVSAEYPNPHQIKLYDTDSPDNYGNHTFKYGDHIKLDTSLESTTSQPPGFYTVNCYYVDDKGSREINCPASISARVRFLNPELQVNVLQSVQQTKQIPSWPYNFNKYQDSYEIDNVQRRFTAGGSPISVEYVYRNEQIGNFLTSNVLTIDPGLSYNETWPHDNKILLSCYGLIGLQSDLYDNLRTPAYFKYFEGTANLQTADLNKNYNYVRSHHLASFNPPFKLLQPNPYKSPNGYLYFYSTNKLPESVDTPITELSSKPAAKIKDPNDMKYHLPIICWDWGQPDLCTQQLKALGFTDQDLSPTAP